MKTKTITIITAIFAATLFTFTGCKKDTVTGPAGAAGAAGAAGPAGTNGNANVVSATYTLTLWSSIFDTGTEYAYEKAVACTAITQDIYDKGAVMAYLYDSNLGGWVALPYSVSFNGLTNAWNYVVAVNSITIRITGYDATGSPGTVAYNGVVVRVVAITSSGRMAYPEVDLNNYEEVKKAFGLKD